jgi:coproporphyrinogen III oxidase-like Fe-S oxidoreductase
MDHSSENDITEKAKHLEAENESLKSLMQEYQQVEIRRNREARALEEKVAAGAAAISSFDQQAAELKRVRNYIQELMQQAEAAVQRETELEKQVSLSVSTGFQLEEIRSKYNLLQVQLDDLSDRLQQLQHQAMVQQQYAGRIAELESLLANAEQEIDLLKNPPPKEEPLP